MLACVRACMCVCNSLYIDFGLQLKKTYHFTCVPNEDSACESTQSDQNPCLPHENKYINK